MDTNLWLNKHQTKSIYLTIVMSKKGDLYQKLFQAHLRAHPQMSKENNQKKTVNAWNAAKSEFPKESDFMNHIETTIKELNLKATQRLANNSLLKHFGKVSLIL